MCVRVYSNQFQIHLLRFNFQIDYILRNFDFKLVWVAHYPDLLVVFCIHVKIKTISNHPYLLYNGNSHIDATGNLN